jgi:hypothetical protein
MLLNFEDQTESDDFNKGSMRIYISICIIPLRILIDNDYISKMASATLSDCCMRLHSGVLYGGKDK